MRFWTLFLVLALTGTAQAAPLIITAKLAAIRMTANACPIWMLVVARISCWPRPA